MPPASWVVEARALRKTYRLSKTNVYDALRGVDVRLARGELAAIVGPSGSGKSTLLNVLGTLDRPTSGTVLIDGIDTPTLRDNKLAELRNRKIGFIFQNYSLINRMTALENVSLPMIALGVAPQERARRARAALDQVGLGDRVANRPVELSGGEQQRVAIARSLVNRPSILFADEPTGNLDTRTSQSIIALLKQINAESGVTMAIVTHDLQVARQTRRIIHIRDGLVERDETTEALTA